MRNDTDAAYFVGLSLEPRVLVHVPLYLDGRRRYKHYVRHELRRLDRLGRLHRITSSNIITDASFRT